MVDETRYMRSDLDGTFYKLLTDNTTTASNLAVSISGAVAGYIAIRVRDQDENIIVDWTEIQVTGTTYTLFSISVDIPETYVEKIIVDVRVKAVPTTNTRSFITDTLNATVSGTWNFKLWAIYKYIPSPANVTTVTFTHGSSTYDSRIENFSWSIAGQVYEINLDATCQSLATQKPQSTFNITKDAAINSQSLHIPQSTFNVTKETITKTLTDLLLELGIPVEVTVKADAIKILESAFNISQDATVRTLATVVVEHITEGVHEIFLEAIVTTSTILTAEFPIPLEKGNVWFGPPVPRPTLPVYLLVLIRDYLETKIEEVN